MTNKLLIAIDGPAASGKGTLAKLLGEKLNLPVLYTGNIYRAIAYKILTNKIDPKDKDQVVQAAKELILEDLDNSSLNQEKVGKYASIIGVYPELREVTYKFQREFIDNAFEGAVIEGRDIGTVICPEAKFKFYVFADVEIRAKRRADQNPDIDYNVILSDLKLRDDRDQNRVIAPLKPANDAVMIDNGNLNAEETLATILKIIVG